MLLILYRETILSSATRYYLLKKHLSHTVDCSTNIFMCLNILSCLSISSILQVTWLPELLSAATWNAVSRCFHSLL